MRRLILILFLMLVLIIVGCEDKKETKPEIPEQINTQVKEFDYKICTNEVVEETENVSREVFSKVLNKKIESCHKSAISLLIQDCVSFNTTMCGNVSSCDYLLNELESLIKEELPTVDFNFQLCNKEGEFFMSVGERCKFRKGSSKLPMPYLEEDKTLIPTLSECAEKIEETS